MEIEDLLEREDIVRFIQIRKKKKMRRLVRIGIKLLLLDI